jgi:hypothetical protein
VQLEENHVQKTFDMRVLDVSDLHMPLAYRGPILIPRSDAVFSLSAGRKLWTVMQEMQSLPSDW